MKIKVIFFLCMIFVFFSCTNDYSVIKLKMIDLNRENRYQIKPIKEFSPEITFARLDRSRGIDDFTIRYIFIKKIREKKLVYQIETSKDIVLFRDSFAIVQQYNGPINYGWFFLVDGKELRLPLMDNIMDSLRTYYGEYFINSTNGYIQFHEDGQVKKTVNYGNCILKDVNFEKLEYGLYKLEDQNLTKISKNGNELKDQKNGLFFVPSPGYGVIAQYPIQPLLNAIDSVYELKVAPLDFAVEMQ